MRYRKLVVRAAPAVLCALAGTARGQTEVHWAAAVSDSWGNAARWSPAIVPDNNGSNTFFAVLDAPGPQHTVSLDMDRDVTRLDVIGAQSWLDLTSFRLDVVQDFNLNQGWLLGAGAGSTITVGGVATMTNVMLMSVGQMRTNGSLRFNSNIAGDDICDTGIDHQGSSCEWNSNSDIRFNEGSTFVNGAASTFTIGGAGSFVWNGSGSRPAFTNQGTLLKSGSAGLTFFDGPTFANAGTVRAESGTLKTNGLDINGNANTLDAGVYVAKNGATLSMVDASDVAQQILTNKADVTLDGAGSVFDAMASVQTNHAAGKFTVTNGNAFTTAGNFQNDGLLTVGPAGTVRVKPGSALTNLSAGTLSGGVFKVSGTLKADGLSVTTMNASLTLDGATSAIVDQSDADALQAMTSIGSAGAFTIRNGRDFTTGGSFALASTGVLNIEAGTTFRVRAGSTLANFVGGELVDGVFNVQGKLQADNAQIKIINTNIDIDGTGSQIVDGSNNDAFSALEKVKVNGRFTMRGGRDVTTSGSLTTDTSSKVKIGPASTRDVSILTVNGDYLQDIGSTLTLDGGTLITTGTAFLNGSLEGNGTINGDAVVGGVISPGQSPGALAIDGSVMFLEHSSFVVELLGGQPGVSYDRLNVGGAVRMGEDGNGELGTLDVFLGYAPYAGAYWDVMTYASCEGRFGDVRTHGFDPHYQATIAYMPDRLRISVVPAPGAAALGALGLLAAGRRRR